MSKLPTLQISAPAHRCSPEPRARGQQPAGEQQSGYQSPVKQKKSIGHQMVPCVITSTKTRLESSILLNYCFKSTEKGFSNFTFSINLEVGGTEAFGLVTFQASREQRAQAESDLPTLILGPDDPASPPPFPPRHERNWNMRTLIRNFLIRCLILKQTRMQNQDRYKNITLYILQIFIITVICCEGNSGSYSYYLQSTCYDGVLRPGGGVRR